MDKKALKEAKPFLIKRGKCALICIDMQNDFVEKGAVVEVPGIAKTIPRIRRLQRTCRELGVPVIHTRWLVDPRISPMHLRIFERLRNQGCRPGTRGSQICEALAAAPGEYVVDKYTFDAFQYTALEFILNNIRGTRVVDTVIICGTVTRICVMGTARTASERGFKVVIGSDVVSERSPRIQEVVLDMLDFGFGRVMTSKRIIEALRNGEKT